MDADLNLLIVGNSGEIHVGAHLRRAAQAIGLRAGLLDTAPAFAGAGWRRKIDWWLRGHRPSRLREFDALVLGAVERGRPAAILTTGIAPVSRGTLDALRARHIVTMNFLTDDPWNPAHRAQWFLEALPAYDHIFSPRAANLADLRDVAPGAIVTRLPFAYAPDVHFPEAAQPGEGARYDADVMFAGGADRDRHPLVETFLRAGLRTAVYGNYWDRNPATRAAARGTLDAQGLRKATAAARVCLCLVRRANRDGHAMRSYETPAMRGRILAEDTDDHRAMFGPEGTAALYFRDIDEAVAKARQLVADSERGDRLAAAAHRLITEGANRYADRLTAMLQVARRAAA